MIRGTTSLIAHIGFPTFAFKAPMIYNPYFEQAGIDAVVVPMGCQSEDYPTFLRSVFTLTNIRGALITMPHKVTTTGLVDVLSPTARIAGACNAVRRGADGRLEGDMFDGEGFVRGVLRKGVVLAAAGSAVPSPRRWRRRASARSRCSIATPNPPRRWAHACASTTRRWKSSRARTIRPATTWWSTPRRWA
jgi:hypothetical protein